MVERDDIDIIVEVVGGIEPVRSLLLTCALRSGKSVVSANKALLAEDGAALHAAAAEAGVDLYYEAAVAGAIPLLRPLRESLAGDRITRVMGIVNGTTNFILSRMDANGASFTEALAEATALGYAEADPSADVDGFDAAAKAAILAGLAFHTTVTSNDVYRQGIGDVSAADVASAKALGCTVKLLAICERVVVDGVDSVSARVYPAMIPRSHPLAGVNDAYNAVFVEAEAAGSLMFYGRGAGGAPTASAVLGDLVAVARNKVSGNRGADHRRVRRSGGAADGQGRHSLSRGPRRGRPSRRTGLGRRVPSPTPASASRPSARRVAAPRPLWSWSPTAPRTRRSRPPSRSLSTMSSIGRAASVMRVEGMTGDSADGTADRRSTCHQPRHPVRQPWHRAIGARTGRGPASSRPTATGCRSAPTRRSSPCSRAAPRSSRPTSCPGAPVARCSSRSRAPTRPVPSRTAA